MENEQQFTKEQEELYEKLWDRCECNDCKHVWFAGSSEQFNFSHCDLCGSGNIGGEYHDPNFMND